MTLPMSIGSSAFFKTFAKSLSNPGGDEVPPAITISDLRLIIDYFPTPGFEFELDPTFEPETKGRDEGMPPPNPDNTEIFRILQKYNRLNLLIPIKAQHMWNAAMESKSCKLTVLGEHYRKLVSKNRI